MLTTNKADFITRTQKGDAEAFTPLVRKYHPKLYTHIHGRIKDVEVASAHQSDSDALMAPSKHICEMPVGISKRS